MRIDNEIKLDFKDVLIRPKRSTLNSRSEVSLTREYDFKRTPGASFSGVPIIAANMDTVGTMSMARSFRKHDMLVALHKFYNEEDLFKFYSSDTSCHNSFYTLGTSDDDLQKFRNVNKRLRELNPDNDPVRPRKVCIDVANGYSEKFNDFIKRFKEEFSYMVVMAGNVVTGEMTEELILSGADIVKIGIGPGSVCTTRKMTGVGYPQLSAIIECADAAHGLNAFICGDGGITNSGDVAKAFGAGADFIMCGGLFAGHRESEAAIQGATRKLRSNLSVTNPIMNPTSDTSTYIFSYIDENNERHSHTIEKDICDLVTQKFSGTKTLNDVELPDHFYEVTIPENAKIAFYGMSSEEAMNKYYNGKAKYRASEGKIVYVDYKGPVENTITEVLGGLRSACTYTGAKSLKQLSKCTTFIRVTQQLNESLGKS